VPTYLNDVMIDWLFVQDLQNRQRSAARELVLAR